MPLIESSLSMSRFWISSTTCGKTGRGGVMGFSAECGEGQRGAFGAEGHSWRVLGCGSGEGRAWCRCVKKMHCGRRYRRREGVGGGKGAGRREAAAPACVFARSSHARIKFLPTIATGIENNVSPTKIASVVTTLAR
jgi:hypothetical protein